MYINLETICYSPCKDLVSFIEPSAGMFVWLKINGVEDTRKLIYEKAFANEVLFIAGNAFFPDQTKTYPYVRASYSISTPEQIETVKLFVNFKSNLTKYLFRVYLDLVKFFVMN